MSQKDGINNDLSEIKKNASNHLLNIQQQQFPPSQPLLQDQQSQQQPSASNPQLGNTYNNQMPLPFYNNWDWYNYYSTAAMPGPINPSPFDIGYKDEFKNYQAPFQQQQTKHLKKQKSSINLTSLSSSNINTVSSALGGINNLKSTSLNQINDIKNHSDINNMNKNHKNDININNNNHNSISKNNKKIPQVVTSSSSKNKTNISAANSRSSSVNSRAESQHSWASRDSLNDTNYQMYNQSPFSQSTGGTTSNQKQNAPNKQQYPTSQQQSYTNPYSLPPMPFMDPSSYMYYQMAAAAAAYGYPPLPYTPYNPYAGAYGNGAIGGSAMSMVNLSQRQLQDDQQSIQSFHNFDDTRSERKVNFNTSSQVNKAQSIAGGNMFNIKSEPKPSLFTNSNNNNLLIEDNFQNLDNNNGPSLINGLIETNSTIQNILVKRDENRLTPQMHQLPHVRACFSINSLVQIRANDPCEGQPALVDLVNLGDMMEHYLLNLKNMSSNNTKKLSITSTDQQDSLNINNDDDESSISYETRNEILINYKLLQEFPGPLVRENNTSKAQVIQFCQKNVKECLSNTNINLIDPQSHALLWDYLALLVRQNGIVDLKTDISSLLLTGIGSNDTHNQWSLTNSTNNNLNIAGSNINQPITKGGESISSASSEKSQDFVLVNNDDTIINNSNINDSKTNSSTTIPLNNNGKTQASKPISEEEMHLNKLRQLLGAGQKSDAIELAIKYNMWPHALFLASSINSSTTSTSVLSNSMSLMSIAGSNSNTNNMLVNANAQEAKALNKVKLRFINSLQPQDPIHTCYQLLIGRIPAIATNIPKTEWNDWRRHLAMIVSNVDDSNKDLVITTIKTMGDSLAFNGRVAASHFCYLLSNCPFGSFNKKSSKLVLIGSSHNQDFNKFCQTSAIQATEIYEFATGLSNLKILNSTSGFLDHFVRYKLIYASRLLEHGLFNEACKYIEVIAKTVNLNPNLHSDKISSVYQLANRLRIYDSDFNLDDLMNNSTNLSLNEPQWLQELTNNFKKINLNKVWHLLPSNNSIKEDNQSKQTEKPIVNMNIEPKLEPKISEISSPLSLGDPASFNNNINIIQIKNPSSNLSMGSNLQSSSNANIDLNKNLQSHQSMPFVPSTPQITQVESMQQQLPNWESQQSFQDPNISNPYRRASASSTHSIQYQQPHQQLHSSQHQTNNQQDLINQMTPNFSKNQFNFPLNSNVNSTASQLQSNYYQPSQTPSNRSRQSSVSVSNNDISNNQNQIPFAPFNPYQPQQQIYKSQTFPTHQDSQNIVNSNLISNSTSQHPPFNSQLNLNSSDTYFDPQQNQQNKNQVQPTNSTRKSIKSEEEEEGNDQDDHTAKNSKTTKKEDDKKALNSSQVSNQEGGLLKRFVNYIVTRPPNSAKAMVLPDDKNKSIVWDDKLKRYVNKDAKEDAYEKIKPPPTFLPPQTTPVNAQPLQQQQQQQQQQHSTLNSTLNDVTISNAAGAPQPTNLPTENRFSLKSQNLSRRSYYSKVDVLSSQTKKLTDQGMQQTALLSNMPPPSQIPPRFFVPEPTALQDQSQDSNQHQQYHQNQENISDSNNISNNQQEQSYYNPQNNPQYQQPQASNDYYSSQLYQQPMTMIQNYQQLNDNNNYVDENDSATTTNSNSAESYNGGLGAGGSQTTSSSNDSSAYYKQQNYNNNYNQNNDQYNNYTSNI